MPENANAWKIRGRVRIDLGQTSDAVADLRQAGKLDGNLAAACESLAEANILLGRWDEAEKLISERFRLPVSPSNPIRSWHLPDLVATAFRSSAERHVWRQQANRFALAASGAREELAGGSPTTDRATDKPTRGNGRVFAPANPFARLADSLVRSLTKKAYAEAPAEALEAWADVWREVAAEHPDLSLAVRLFGVGVRYLRTKDERVLLDLVQEERSILRDLFGLDADAEEK